MNVYDCANELAKAMRESHEFKKMQEARLVLDKDADAKKMVNEFLQLSQEVEIAKYQKQDVPAEKTEKLQKLYGVLALNSGAMEYLNAFMRFNMMMQDISKAIEGPVKEAVGEK